MRSRLHVLCWCDMLFSRLVSLNATPSFMVHNDDHLNQVDWINWPNYIDRTGRLFMPSAPRWSRRLSAGQSHLFALDPKTDQLWQSDGSEDFVRWNRGPFLQARP